MYLKIFGYLNVFYEICNLRKMVIIFFNFSERLGFNFVLDFKLK